LLLGGAEGRRITRSPGSKKEPTPAPGSWVLTGTGCQIEYNCISSNNHPGVYGNNEECTVELFGDIPLRTEAFSTVSGFWNDYLRIGRKKWSGSSGPPNGTYTGTISWSTDNSFVKSGWKLCRTDWPDAAPCPTPAPPPSWGWAIVGTGCQADGDCINSNNYPSDYGNNEECTIEITGQLKMWTEAFKTSTSTADHLTVAGVKYSGDAAPPPGTYTGNITWSSDHWIGEEGWRVCFAK